MDLLEEANLVKIAGYRKPIKGRMTEKLYCRTALLYYNQDSPSTEKWWKAPEYQQLKQKSTDFLILYKNLKQNTDPKINALIDTYLETRNRNINNLLKVIQANPEFVKFFSKLSVMEMKSVVTDIALFQIFMNEDELIEGFKNLK